MNLIIDTGNTAVKIAFFREETLIKNAQFYVEEMNAINAFISSESYDKSIISSVASKEITEQLLNCVKNPLLLSATTVVPFKNLYATPETLGKDRIANATGGFARFRGKNTLVVDAGTCLKFDFISSDGAYYGGAIAPGLLMRFKALHNFTANLPLIEKIETNQPLFGKDTASSIKVGCVNGMKNEIMGVIQAYKKEYPELQVILTGGDTHFFENIALSEKNSIFADLFLTLKGLNTILNYNA